MELSNRENILYMEVYGYYKSLILTGKLQKGSKLPSVRRCAAELGVSRTTVENAYLQLAADGYILSKPQSGYYVTDIASYSQKKNMTAKKSEERTNKPVYDFASLKADRESFDFDLWRRYLKSALRQDDRLLSYGEVQGETELRQVLSKYITENRNVMCNEDDIVIGAGVQSLLHILCGIMDSRKTVFFRDPSFLQGIAIFDDHRFAVTENENGADVIYISPSHINSWGDVMPTEQRLELIKQAKLNGTLIIEDDYDSEFGYFNRPTPSLQGLDGGENVVYIGTFSKLLVPSIRISFMILPEKLKSAYNKKAEAYSQTVSTTDQIALCQFIRDGHMSRRIKKVRKLYAQKAIELNNAIKTVFGERAKTHIGQTGFVIMLELDYDMPSSEIIKRAEKSGISLRHGEPSEKPQVLLSCSSVKTQDFLPAMRLLKEAIERQP